MTDGGNQDAVPSSDTPLLATPASLLQMLATCSRQISEFQLQMQDRGSETVSPAPEVDAKMPQTAIAHNVDVQDTKQLEFDLEHIDKRFEDLQSLYEKEVLARQNFVESEVLARQDFVAIEEAKLQELEAKIDDERHERDAIERKYNDTLHDLELVFREQVQIIIGKVGDLQETHETTLNLEQLARKSSNQRLVELERRCSSLETRVLETVNMHASSLADVHVKHDRLANERLVELERRCSSLEKRLIESVQMHSNSFADLQVKHSKIIEGLQHLEQNRNSDNDEDLQERVSQLENVLMNTDADADSEETMLPTVLEEELAHDERPSPFSSQDLTEDHADQQAQQLTAANARLVEVERRCNSLEKRLIENSQKHSSVFAHLQVKHSKIIEGLQHLEENRDPMLAHDLLARVSHLENCMLETVLQEELTGGQLSRLNQGLTEEQALQLADIERRFVECHNRDSAPEDASVGGSSENSKSWFHPQIVTSIVDGIVGELDKKSASLLEEVDMGQSTTVDSDGDQSGQMSSAASMFGQK